MDEITRQVTRARRRMLALQFVQFVSRALLGALLVAVIALAIPKIWSVEFGGSVWTWSWIAGAIAVGLLIGGGMTYLRASSSLDVAIEIDRRFELKERVSSSLALSPSEREAEAGSALLRDASRRVSRVEIHAKFPWQVRWPELSPLVPMLAVVALVMTPDAEDTAQASTQAAVDVRQQIYKVAEQARQQFKQQRKQIAERNLAEIEDLLLQAERVAENISKDDGIDRKKAAIKLNNLARELENRRSAIGDRAELKKQLDQLKDLKGGRRKNSVRQFVRETSSKRLRNSRLFRRSSRGNPFRTKKNNSWRSSSSRCRRNCSNWPKRNSRRNRICRSRSIRPAPIVT